MAHTQCAVASTIVPWFERGEFPFIAQQLLEQGSNSIDVKVLIDIENSSTTWYYINPRGSQIYTLVSSDMSVHV
jgi:hypothetical protein